MKLPLRPSRGLLKLIGIAGTVALATPVFAQTPAAAPAVDPAALSGLRVGLDTVWVLVTAMLVFWMNAGFATLA